MSDLKIEMNRKNAELVGGVIRVLTGAAVTKHHREKIRRKIVKELGLDEDGTGSREDMPERITLFVTRRELDALWYGISDLAADEKTTGMDYINLERVARAMRLYGRWTKHHEALELDGCEQAIDDDDEVDPEGEDGEERADRVPDDTG